MIKSVLKVLAVIAGAACIAFCGILFWGYRNLAGSYESLKEEVSEQGTRIDELESGLLLGNERVAETEQKDETILEEPASSAEEKTSDPFSDLGETASLQPGDIILEDIDSDVLNLYFSSSEIMKGDSVYNRIYGKSYRENDTVFLSDLRYLILLHYNFNHDVQVGEMIVNKDIADQVLSIFKELFEAEYEIQSIYLIDNYWTGDPDSTDSASIEANNTSCFNYRNVTGGDSLSMHAYGCAIDINPQQNPYIWYTSDGTLMHSHSNADAYVDRSSGASHMITAGDVCCSIFEKFGFSWGGYWDNPIDYQHFEKDLY